MAAMGIFIINLLFILTIGEACATAPEQINEWCKQYKYDKCELVQAIVKSESSYNPNAFVDEKSGSYGLMMIQCGTAKDPRLDSPLKYSCDQLFNPQINIRYGVMYLKMLEDTMVVFHIEDLIAAYNAGLTNIDGSYTPRRCRDYNQFKYKGFPPVECYPGEYINEEYVWKVYRRYNYLKTINKKRILK